MSGLITTFRAKTRLTLQMLTMIAVISPTNPLQASITGAA